MMLVAGIILTKGDLHCIQQVCTDNQEKLGQIRLFWPRLVYRSLDTWDYRKRQNRRLIWNSSVWVFYKCNCSKHACANQSSITRAFEITVSLVSNFIEKLILISWRLEQSYNTVHMLKWTLGFTVLIQLNM